jgi:hypothetical protein
MAEDPIKNFNLTVLGNLWTSQTNVLKRRASTQKNKAFHVFEVM